MLIVMSAKLIVELNEGIPILIKSITSPLNTLSYRLPNNPPINKENAKGLYSKYLFA